MTVDQGTGSGFPQRYKVYLLVLGAVLCTALLRFSLFPPFSIAESAYVFLIPLLLAVRLLKRGKSVFFVAWLCGWIFWIASLFWLRHVTFVGTFLLSGILAVFFAVWICWVWSCYRKQSINWYLPILLAAGWVVLEWTRSWLFWGFPWSPLSVSQWNRPAVLPIVSVTGSWGLSFLLVWINLLLANWIRTPFTAWEKKGFLPFVRSVPLSLVVAFGVLFSGSIWFFYHSRDAVPSEAMRVAFIQPYTELKWEPEVYRDNLEALWRTTRESAKENPDIILWPESATPYPVIGNDWMRSAIEALAEEMDTPILMGNMAYFPDPGFYENAIFLVDPRDGLASEYYVKRKLVPFGEFVPFRSLIPFLDKFVPIPLDCKPGDEAVLFRAGNLPSERMGALICYEDIFPHLGRDNVRAGADWLFVATNNAWYGEEAGAYQHAKHAVLRAAELRRPILRSGNGGWSGWIDEWGRIRYEVSDDRGSIYFRGQSVVPVWRDLRFEGYQTIYVRYGDWFVWFCLTLTGLYWIEQILRWQRILPRH